MKTYNYREKKWTTSPPINWRKIRLIEQGDRWCLVGDTYESRSTFHEWGFKWNTQHRAWSTNDPRIALSGWHCLNDRQAKGRLEEKLGLNLLSPKLSTKALPEINATFYPYQEIAIKQALLQRGSLFGHTMGGGKTLMTLAVAQTLAPSSPILIVVKKHLIPQWGAEITHFLNRPWLPANNRRAVPYDDRTIVLAGYEEATAHLGRPRSFNEGLFKVDTIAREYAVIIFDEAHRCKNPKAKTTGFLSALKADVRIGATGTPVMNDGQEARHVAEFLGIKIPRMRKNPYNMFHWLRGKGALLYEDPAVINKSLPPITHKVEMVDAKPVLTGVKMRDRYLLEKAKIQAAIELATKAIRERGSVFVVSNYRDICDDVAKALGSDVSKRRYAPLFPDEKFIGEVKPMLTPYYGGVDQDTRERLKRNNIVVATPQVCEGGNFQHINTMIFLGPAWTGASVDQAVKRIHRHGQKEPVLVYHLRMDNEVEEWLTRIVSHKKREMSPFRDSLEGVCQ